MYRFFFFVIVHIYSGHELLSRRSRAFTLRKLNWRSWETTVFPPQKDNIQGISNSLQARRYRSEDSVLSSKCHTAENERVSVESYLHVY